jgi:hypothetical protein
MERIAQQRRAERPSWLEVSITMRIWRLMCSSIHREAIVPTKPLSFFSKDRQYDGEIRQGSLLVLEFDLGLIVGRSADLACGWPGLAQGRWRAPSLARLADAGQIRGVEAFPAQEFGHGFVAGLRFEIDREFLLGSQKAPLFAEAFGPKEENGNLARTR